MIEQNQRFDCVIVGKDQLPFQLSDNDPNTGNMCFVSHRMLDRLGIRKCAYRILATAKNSHLVLMFGAQKLEDGILGVTPVLADTLQLHFKHRESLKVDTPSQLSLSVARQGLPEFPQASSISLTPVSNQAHSSFYQPSVLKKIKLEPFYFRLGQEIRIEVDLLSEDLYADQKLQVRKAYIRAKRQAAKSGRNAHATIRLVVTGVACLRDGTPWSGVLRSANESPEYFMCEPDITKVHFQRRCVRRWNTLKKLRLDPAVERIFSDSPSYQAIADLVSAKLKNEPSDRHPAILLVHSKPSYLLDEFLEQLAEKQLMNYLPLDCSLESSLQPISQFLGQLHQKTPVIGHIKNLDWVHDLLSGNLQSKRSSQRTVEEWFQQFRSDLLKRSDSMPALLVLTYQHDNFDIKNIEGTHHKFEPTPAENNEMQLQLISNCELFTQQEQVERVREMAAPMAWGQLSRILKKSGSFEAVLKEVEQTLKKIVVAKIPEVKWSDIGGLDLAKEEIIETILLPKNHPYIFDDLIRPRTGLLFYGPPGTGKTLLAKCIANECKMNFISVKGPEMLNMYIGESEKNVRQTFEKANENRPCIIFFDELDALIPKRGSGSDSSQVMDRIVAELLMQMDLAAKHGGIFVIGATNRPDLLDPSIMRPGRFDKQIYLGICTQREDRIKILQAQTSKLALEEDVDFGAIVDGLPTNFTGADFYGLTSKAVTNSLNRRIGQIERKQIDASEERAKLLLKQQDFVQAAALVKPSVTLAQLQKFEQLKAKYS